MRDVLLTYGAPLIGAVLLSVGIAGGVMGGYSTIQERAGLCDEPIILVSTVDDTERQLQAAEGGGPDIGRIAFANLSTGEQRAFEEAIAAQSREAEIGEKLSHRGAFERGVVVSYEGSEYYTTLASENECLDANPLLLPLGVVSILLGIAGVLTPPLYRRYVAFEQRTQDERRY